MDVVVVAAAAEVVVVVVVVVCISTLLSMTLVFCCLQQRWRLSLLSCLKAGTAQVAGCIFCFCFLYFQQFLSYQLS